MEKELPLEQRTPEEQEKIDKEIWANLFIKEYVAHLNYFPYSKETSFMSEPLLDETKSSIQIVVRAFRQVQGNFAESIIVAIYSKGFLKEYSVAHGKVEDNKIEISNIEYFPGRVRGKRLNSELMGTLGYKAIVDSVEEYPMPIAGGIIFDPETELQQ